MINKTYEKTNSSYFKQLKKLINYEQYDYYFAFSPSWFGLFLGLLLKKQIQISINFTIPLQIKFFSKFWKIIFSKIFFTQSKVVNRFKLLRENQDIHQTK